MELKLFGGKLRKHYSFCELKDGHPYLFSYIDVGDKILKSQIRIKDCGQCYNIDMEKMGDSNSYVGNCFIELKKVGENYVCVDDFNYLTREQALKAYVFDKKSLVRYSDDIILFYNPSKCIDVINDYLNKDEYFSILNKIENVDHLDLFETKDGKKYFCILSLGQEFKLYELHDNFKFSFRTAIDVVNWLNALKAYKIGKIKFELDLTSSRSDV